MCWGYSSVVESLPSEHKALGTVASPHKRSTWMNVLAHWQRRENCSQMEWSEVLEWIPWSSRGTKSPVVFPHWRSTSRKPAAAPQAHTVLLPVHLPQGAFTPPHQPLTLPNCLPPFVSGPFTLRSNERFKWISHFVLAPVTLIRSSKQGYAHGLVSHKGVGWNASLAFALLSAVRVNSSCTLQNH